FSPIFTVVPKTCNYGPQRPRIRPESRAATVALKPDHGPSPQPRAAHDDVADQAFGLRAGMLRRHVEQLQSNQLFALSGPVVAAEALVTAADAQHHGAASH